MTYIGFNAQDMIRPEKSVKKQRIELSQVKELLSQGVVQSRCFGKDTETLQAVSARCDITIPIVRYRLKYLKSGDSSIQIETISTPPSCVTEDVFWLITAD